MSSSGPAISEEAAAAAPQQQQQPTRATETTPLVRGSRVSITAVLTGDLPEVPARDAEQGGNGGGQGGAEEEEDSDNEPGEEFVHIPAPDAEGGTTAVVGGEDAKRRQSSIFRADIEKHIRKADPGRFAWLTSPEGVAFQAGLCITLILISTYEVVVKSRAIRNLGYTLVTLADGSQEKRTSFMSASITTNASIASLFIALAIAAYRKELYLIFDREAFLPRLRRYFVPGCGFQFTAYIQVLALGFIAPDVFKVLEQTRLLITAFMSLQFFGHRQSVAGWNALVVTTLAAVSYSETSGHLKNEACHAKIPGMLGPIAGMAGDASAAALAKATEYAAQCQDKGASKAYMLGLILTASFVLLQVACCILCESVLKQEKKTPFYIQKFFLELPGSIFGLLITNVLNPTMYHILLAPPFDFDPQDRSMKSMKGKEGELFEHIVNPVSGWNTLVWTAFLLFLCKSWCSGFLTKQLSSLTKQLCSVVGVGIVYFLMKVHPPEGPSFFDPRGLSTVDKSMVVADFCVLCAVVSYTLAGRDKRKKVQFKTEALEARALGGGTATAESLLKRA